MSKLKSPIDRHNWIVQRLHQQGSLCLEEITRELEVSAMTVNRDVRQLAVEGLVRRTHGWVNLPEMTHQDTRCAACQAPISNHMQILLITASRPNLTYCCPHCGFSQLNQFTDILGAFATDFLYGTTLDAYKATFVIGSRVWICCEPSVLSFKNHEDAEAFCFGFGGNVFTINEAINFFSPSKSKSN